MKRFSIVSHFCLPLLFFLWDLSRANDIKKKKQKKNNQTSLCQPFKPVIELFLFRKTDKFDCKIPYNET